MTRRTLAPRRSLLLPAPPPGMTRRGFLGLVVASAAAAAVGCSDDDGGPAQPGTTERPGPDPSGLPVPDLAAPFTLGVASGDPTAEAVILWTRLAPEPLAAGGRGGMPDQPVPVRWEVATDEGFGDVVASGTEVASPVLGHSVHVDATGLEEDTWYWYRFHVGDHTSPVGRTRTMPAEGADVERFRFAFASCQSWQSGYYTAYAHMAEEELDAVVFLGDYIYEGGVSEGAVRPHDGPEVMELGAYRNRHALYRGDEHLQATHARFPWILTWDDHEVDNNYANDRHEGGDPPEQFLERRAAGYQAYYEHQPLRVAPPEGADLDLYRTVEVGGLARIHVLDTRQYRSPQACDDGSSLPAAPMCDEAADPGRTILGTEQREWLVEGLQRGDVAWNVVANQVVLTKMPIAGTLFNMDQWDGYTADRDAVLEAMAASGTPSIVVTGDIHLSGVGQLGASADDPEASPLGAELVGTSIASSFPAEFVDIVEGIGDELPYVRYVNARQRGYVVVELTPDEARADYRLVATALEPTSTIATDASFLIDRDGRVRRA